MRGNTAQRDTVRDKVFEAIKQNPHGVTLRAIQKRLGIHRPDDEDQRQQVWRVNAAIAGLKHDGMIVGDVQGGLRCYYPQAA